MHRLLTESEAANYLRVSRSLLRQQRMRSSRDSSIPLVPFIRLGRHVRYDIVELDAWIEQQKAG
jgi:predicted DNA-binding transcriptional regulator AlpA